MGILSASLGIMLLFAVSADFIASTVGANGQGRASAWVGERVYSLLNMISTRINRPRRLTGPLVVLAIGLFWVLSAWMAWTLIFFGTESLVTTQAEEPGDFPAVFAYVGSVLSTAGNSSLEPAGFLGKLLNDLIAIQGMAVLTMTVSYLLNLSQTVMKSRAFCAEICAADAFEDLDRSVALAEFRLLCARLHVSPLALYFAPPHGEAALADALIIFVDKVKKSAAASAHDRAVVEKGLRLLPLRQSAGDETPSVERLSEWRRRYGAA